MQTLSEAMNTAPVQVSRLRKFANGLAPLVIVCVLYGAGCVTGYWLSNNHAQEESLRDREDHLAEIERLQHAWGVRLDSISGKVASTAETLENAAETAAIASNTAANAAETAKKAARTAAQLPEPTRQQINRSIDAANRQAK